MNKKIKIKLTKKEFDSLYSVIIVLTEKIYHPTSIIFDISKYKKMELLCVSENFTKIFQKMTNKMINSNNNKQINISLNLSEAYSFDFIFSKIDLTKIDLLQETIITDILAEINKKTC